ncbi:uncharacterized protein isoform X2 [Castor canadensis]|uniref:Uncharacterized protein isoform X2 n=1 Tax=Castor canadensis TaxID=51338 RepID=A0AC58NG23_CASCN
MVTAAGQCGKAPCGKLAKASAHARGAVLSRPRAGAGPGGTGNRVPRRAARQVAMPGLLRDSSALPGRPPPLRPEGARRLGKQLVRRALTRPGGGRRPRGLLRGPRGNCLWA